MGYICFALDRNTREQMYKLKIVDERRIKLLSKFITLSERRVLFLVKNREFINFD